MGNSPFLKLIRASFLLGGGGYLYKATYITINGQIFNPGMHHNQYFKFWLFYVERTNLLFKSNVRAHCCIHYFVYHI